MTIDSSVEMRFSHTFDSKLANPYNIVYFHCMFYRYDIGNKVEDERRSLRSNIIRGNRINAVNFPDEKCIILYTRRKTKPFLESLSNKENVDF